jgi:multidrug efflux system outer membrane protein
MKIPMAILLCTSLLSGCTMIPDYLRPDLPTSTSWHAEETLPELSTESQQAAADIVWQEFFISPGMQKVVETALTNNRDLRVAALNVEAARALYRIERSDLFPNVNAGAAGARQKVTEAQSTSNPLFGSPQEYITSTYTANLASTAFELDLFGRLRSQNEAALESYFATGAARDAAQISLIAETANAYLQWLADRKILALVQETLDAQQKSYDLIAKSYEKGVASKLDLAQVRQAVETAKANLALYTRRVMQDQNALVLLMGGKKHLIRPCKPNGWTMWRCWRSCRLACRLKYYWCVRMCDRQNMNCFPAMPISVRHALPFSPPSRSPAHSAMPAATWETCSPVRPPARGALRRKSRCRSFRGGRNIANLDYTKLIKEASIARYERTIQTAFKEVSDELAARSTLDDELGAQRNLVEATQNAYDLSFARYKEGIDNFLNVLDAQRSLFSAQQQEIEIQKQQLANLVNLYKVLGGGAKTQAAQPAKDSSPQSENQ